MISSPILHDIIKSELDHNAKKVFEICKNIPQTRTSNILQKDYWSLIETRQEELNQRYRKADCVWFFEGKKNDCYYIIHEVKTGYYSVSDVYNKYHIGMAGQIWIWGWGEVNFGKFDSPREIKIIDIEHLLPLLKHDLTQIQQGLEM